MQTTDRDWLPTSQREKTFLFSLSLLLMLNTTVGLLLMTGELPVLADLQAESTSAPSDQGRQVEPGGVTQGIGERAQPQWIDESEPVVIEAAPPRVVEAAALDDDAFVTTPVVSVAPPAVAPDPVESIQQAEPEPDDSPVTFFGIGVE